MDEIKVLELAWMVCFTVSVVLKFMCEIDNYDIMMIR